MAFSNDLAFDKFFPPRIQALAGLHWTPLEVAKVVADFLVTDDNVHVLDVGSGQLDDKKEGTRIATYHTTQEEIPPSYIEVNSSFNGNLKFWVKKN